MKRLRCLIGIHRWQQTRPLALNDMFPSPFGRYQAPERVCACCDKEQRWLPGYGGSEDGCWLTKGVEYERS